MSFIQEFKKFALKGNLIDMAIGVVVGAAFGKVVSSFIEGVFMPLVGLLTSGQDFNSLAFVLKEEIKDGSGKIIQPLVTIKYGSFITVTIEFILIAFVIFLVIRAMNVLKKAEAPAPPAPPSNQEVLLAEIRDLLKK
ncbi:MAG: large-conductance mechanosensitive channel protein MscL [Bacteroidetes bacterium]|nr:MAG: large-conductance mechanosensitive channel protein MscL [Bacteroidota bacterium]